MEDTTNQPEKETTEVNDFLDYSRFDEFVDLNRAVFENWADDEILIWYTEANPAHKVAHLDAFMRMPRGVRVALCSNTAALTDCENIRKVTK